MKILNIIMCIDPFTGGGSVARVCLLSKYMSLRGHSCTILTTKKGLHQEHQNNLHKTELVTLPYISERFMIPFFIIPWLIKNVKKYEVIHLSNNWSIITAIAFIFLKVIRKPYYFSAMGWLKIDGRSQILKLIYKRFITLPMIHSAEKCIACSNREINDYLQLGVKKEKIAFIPNGVEVEKFRKFNNKLLFRKNFNIDNRPFILFLGRVDPIKGPDLLVRAFSRICEDFPKYQVIIAGHEIGFLDTLRRETEKLNLRHKVTFLNAIIGKEKISAYKSADLLVIPSRFDSTPIVALEAAACAAPIIITKESDFSELSETSSGIEVEADDSKIEEGLKYALSGKVDLKRLGNNAQKLVLEKYSWDMVCNQWIDLFK
ncbi:glycosyltransferase, partial [Paracoccaceae bacterium]|nr:glycosyltransferase [Paracoccaceae bacterium]